VVLNGGIRNVLRKYGVADRERVSPVVCPDLLIKQDNKLMLLNTKMPKEEGLILYCLTSLDQYTQYVNSQREKGSSAPFCFFSRKTILQGNDVYRMRETPYYVGGCRLYR
jgi:hypothetical protein